MGAAIRSLPAIWCSPASGAPSCAPAHSAAAPLRLRGLSAFRTMTLDQYGHLFGIGWSFVADAMDAGRTAGLDDVHKLRIDDQVVPLRAVPNSA